jgi:hypothetical protein
VRSFFSSDRVCNHPSNWLNDGGWAEADSGKPACLREIVEVVASRQEKMLVFTQFREVVAPLTAFLGQIFGRAGFVLHGQIQVKRRPGAKVSDRLGYLRLAGQAKWKKATLDFVEFLAGTEPHVRAQGPLRNA